jgi:hypothetical protein
MQRVASASANEKQGRETGVQNQTERSLPTFQACLRLIRTDDAVVSISFFDRSSLL